MLKLQQEQARFDHQVILNGRIESAQVAQGPIVVAALGTAHGKVLVACHQLLAHPGPFRLVLPREDQYVIAFEDRNRNGRYDPGEPVAHLSLAKQASAPYPAFGRMDLLLSERSSLPEIYPREVLAEQDAQQPYADLGKAADLEAPMFAERYGKQGFWEPMTFIREARAGVHLLEPYDPQKTPVLFVHGAGGTPQDWRYFIEHLDRTRFQPWVYYYPSGLPLEVSAAWLNDIVVSLHERYRMQRLVVAAHSMGGLVARRFVVLNARETKKDYVRLLVTVSTPWDGVATAGFGAMYSPLAVPSWLDLAPDSSFLRATRNDALPVTVAHHLFYSYLGSTRRPSDTDGVVTLASQLAAHARTNAAQEHGFSAEHSAILADPSAFERFAEVLLHDEKLARDPLATP
jgi:pimeloyl-ACP methyl ester carboxylesterase